MAATIDADPTSMQNSSLVIGVNGDDYAAACSLIKLTPTNGVRTWKGLKPSATASDSDKATWVLDLTLSQDWNKTSSLVFYLITQAGKEVPFEFYPDVNRAFHVDGVCKPVAPEIGGGVDAWMETSVQLPVIGAPNPVLAA